MKTEKFSLLFVGRNSVKSDFLFFRFQRFSFSFLTPPRQRPREGAQLILINSLDAKEKRQRKKSEKLIFRRKQILRFFFMGFLFFCKCMREMSLI
jgi:hypothetical protein